MLFERFRIMRVTISLRIKAEQGISPLRVEHYHRGGGRMTSDEQLIKQYLIYLHVEQGLS